MGPVVWGRLGYQHWNDVCGVIQGVCVKDKRLNAERLWSRRSRHNTRRAIEPRSRRKIEVQWRSLVGMCIGGAAGIRYAAGPSGLESVCAFTSLTMLSNFGSGRSAKNLTWLWDYNRCVGFIPQIRHVHLINY